jgi:signal transduction histidine kinase
MEATVVGKLLGGISQGITIWDASAERPSEMVLVWCNARAIFNAGFPLDEHLGCTADELYGGPLAGSPELELAGAPITRGHVYRACVEQKTNQLSDHAWHRSRAYSVEIIPLGGRLAAEVSTDVTEMALTIRARKEDLRRTLYVLSHDLRKPVRHMIGFSEAFIEDFEHVPEVEKGKGFLLEMRNAGQRMDRLLDGILQFAQLGHVDKWEVVDLVDCWTDAVTDYVIDPELGGSLQPTVASHGLPLVFGSRAMITQLFTNLVANSAKFCKPPINIHMDAYPCKDIPNRVCVEVQDDGPGISRAQRDDVFALFRRGREAKGVPGMGLGLAVCRWIAEAHGGSIAIEDSERGALFRIHLPAVAQHVVSQ